jgi:hypothetical protein
VRIRREELQRGAFVVVPHLIGRHSMPAAHLTGGEQEEDRRQPRTLGALIERLHKRKRAVDLAEVATLRVPSEPEGGDQMCSTSIHERVRNWKKDMGLAEVSLTLSDATGCYAALPLF